MEVKASAHVVIGREGLVIQLVSFNIEAWHAGKSSYGGRSELNHYSIGIELDNLGQLRREGGKFVAECGREVPVKDVYTEDSGGEPTYWHDYTDVQMRVLNEVCELLVDRYPIRDIVGHSDVTPRKDNPPPGVLDQRARMKLLVELSRRLLPVIRKGFVGLGKGTTSNAFVASNQGAVEVDEKHVATLSFELMRLAEGMLYPPKVAVTYDAESKTYSFVQEMEEEKEGYAFANDKVYAVLFESVLNRAKIVTLRERGESGSTSFALPEDWDSANVKAYGFATLNNGSAASDSRYLTIE